MSYIPTHLKPWQLPNYYFGAEWPDYYIFLGRNRDSPIEENSNFETALKRLSELPPWENDVGDESRMEVREGHFLCGWVEWIAIHKDDEAALKLADEMAAALDRYPILDEDDVSRRQDEEADKVWQGLTWRERVKYLRKHRDQFEWISDWKNLLHQAKGKGGFGGWSNEFLH